MEKENTSQFKPGGIHSKYEFWEKELQASRWVLDVIEQGYTIPFEKQPDNYEEPNNASAKRNMTYVQETVLEWATAGIIQITKEKPVCVSPLTVAERKDGLVTKKRLCWDGSRHVNTLLRQQTVTLAHFQRALEITRTGDWQTKYDLKSAFFHIKIRENQIKFLGAAYENESGETIYFKFLYLPFGLGSAVHCITKMFKPVNAYLHKIGIRHSIYIDDGRSLAETKEQAIEDFDKIFLTLEKAGWVIEREKSDNKEDIDQVKEYLGFIIDTRLMRVWLSERKRENIVKTVKETIEGAQRLMKAKTLARCIGLVVAAEPALGSIVPISLRASYSQLESAVENRGWGTSLLLNPEAVEGLKFLIDNLSKFEGAAIRTSGTAISLLSILGPPSEFMKRAVIDCHIPQENKQIWASDASGFGVCSYSLDTKIKFMAGLTQEEMRFSSGHRELLAVLKTLQMVHATVRDPKPTTVFWITDSENLAAFLKKGSSKAHIQKDVFKVWLLARELDWYLCGHRAQTVGGGDLHPIVKSVLNWLGIINNLNTLGGVRTARRLNFIREAVIMVLHD